MEVWQTSVSFIIRVFTLTLSSMFPLSRGSGNVPAHREREKAPIKHQHLKHWSASFTYCTSSKDWTTHFWTSSLCYSEQMSTLLHTTGMCFIYYLTLQRSMDTWIPSLFLREQNLEAFYLHLNIIMSVRQLYSDVLVLW